MIRIIIVDNTEVTLHLVNICGWSGSKIKYDTGFSHIGRVKTSKCNGTLFLLQFLFSYLFKHLENIHYIYLNLDSQSTKQIAQI